ncbi:MAG: hypothetical protein OXN27_01165 [Candidatus Poribacteria bacterium]|nr:hypothetical protein [Candidatus Poribacteria bacterium]MDE0322504.1 hypothetical protein [Candidatus Poribacteria bacterium]
MKHRLPHALAYGYYDLLIIYKRLDLTKDHREADRLWASTPQNVVER